MSGSKIVVNIQRQRPAVLHGLFIQTLKKARSHVAVATAIWLLLMGNLMPLMKIAIFDDGADQYPVLSIKEAESKSCALLFFGLAKQFERKSLPSIRQYILGPNPTCDVYAHTYSKKSVSNGRNNEHNVTLHTDEVYLLPNATVKIETEEAFLQNHDLAYFHQFWPEDYRHWEFPTSMDNMLKQWYSIERVWKMMRKPYVQVGLFRLDVLYTNPINIQDSEAAVPNWGHWGGINDRMFYGTYDNARVWASSRFPLVEKYVQTDQGLELGLHSESYLKYILRDIYKISVEEKPICFQRIRATGELMPDCDPKDTKTWW